MNRVVVAGRVYRQAANPQVDREYREEASKAYSGVTDLLIEEDTLPPNQPSKVEWSGEFEFTVNMRDIDHRFGDLKLILLPEKEGKAPGGFSPKYNVILLRIISKEWLDQYVVDKPFSFGFKFSWLLRLNWAEKFKHEFIHFLDSKRRKRPRKKVEPLEQNTKKWTDEDFTNYFSSPAEFNAWYQQKMEKVERSIRVDLSLSDEFGDEWVDHVWERTFKDWNTFRQYAEEKFTGFQLPWPTEYLSPKYKRKLEKRLYQTYVDLRQELYGK